MVRTGGDGPKGVSASWSRRARRASFGAQERKMGWNSQPTAMVNFDNCRVPVANRIGDEGEGFRIRHDGARRRAAQHRRLRAGRRRPAFDGEGLCA
jgi:alkylation response protein AidB-like acyl-CoA dehydrogenase